MISVKANCPPNAKIMFMTATEEGTSVSRDMAWLECLALGSGSVISS